MFEYFFEIHIIIELVYQLRNIQYSSFISFHFLSFTFQKIEQHFIRILQFNLFCNSIYSFTYQKNIKLLFRNKLKGKDVKIFVINWTDIANFM